MTGVQTCALPISLNEKKEQFGEENISYYTDYDKFLEHDMDVVVLANYANEHAPFAIKAMKKGKHVLSEVLPCQNMKEAVELIETVEETGLIYAYGENCCFMPSTKKMRKMFLDGSLGTFEYGEGEYMHNCEPDRKSTRLNSSHTDSSRMPSSA